MTISEQKLSAHRMTGLGFSPDGKWLALGASDGRLHLWDWRAPGKIRTSFAGSVKHAAPPR